LTNLLGSYDSEEEEEEDEEGEIVEGAPSGVAAFLPPGLRPLIPAATETDEDFMTIDIQQVEDAYEGVEDFVDDEELEGEGEVVPEEGEDEAEQDEDGLSEEEVIGPTERSDEEGAEYSDDDQATLQHLDELVKKRSIALGSGA